MFCYNDTDYKYILGLNAHSGGEDMNKKLGRALRPGHGVYILVLALFAAAALLMGQYALSAVGFALTLLLLLIYS